MAPSDRRGGGNGPPMKFLDELDSENRLFNRLSDAAGGIFDEGYGASIVEDDDGLIEFEAEEAPTASMHVTHRTDRPQVAIRLGPAPGERPRQEEPSSGSEAVLPAASGDEWSGGVDDYDDDYDEFEDDASPPQRPSRQGVRLIAPERDDAPDTDRAWPQAASTPREREAQPTSHSSWLNDLPVVQPRLDAAPAVSQERAADDGPSWAAPLLSFDQPSSQRSWPDRASDEDEVIPAGDEFSLEEALEEDGLDDMHLPTASFGLPSEEDPDPAGRRYFGAPTATESRGAGDTGNWNRLDILNGPPSRTPDKRSSQPSFGVPPSPVWRADESDGALPPTNAAWDGTDDPIHGASPDDDGGWPSSPLWSDPADIVGNRERLSEPVTPPVMPMQSSLKSEIDSRSPLEPKAVVLKTLDGIQRHQADFDEPSDVRSRVPRERTSALGRIETETRPVPLDGGSGSGRMFLIVAVALVITVGAVWQWRSTLFAQPAHLALNRPAAKAPSSPGPALDDATNVPPESAAAPVRHSEAVAPDKVEAPQASSSPKTPAPQVDDDDGSDASGLEKRRASRMDAIDMGRLYVTTDTTASVYIDGKRVGKTPMERPGLELKPGHYDIKVIPHSRGRAYRTDTRVDAGRVRNIDVKFRK